MVSNLYHNYRQSIGHLQIQIERYEQLAKRAAYWKTKNKEVKLIRDTLEARLLPGNDRELVGAKMQGLIKQLAKQAGIKFKSLEPPDTSYSTGEWVLVIQSMRFEASSETLMNFLKMMNNNNVKLEVISLNVRAYRRKLTGVIKIIGFSRVPEKNR